MKKYFVLVFVIVTTYSYGQGIILPEGYKILAETTGDLDKDKNPEKVLVVETTDSTEMGKIREIRIYKKNKTDWALWHLSRTAIMESDAGGMMGDPFTSVEIKKGILIISHEGGSSWKWYVTDKYRYQNFEFKQIGYTSGFGRPAGNEWTDVDMNLSTGKVIYDKKVTHWEDDKEIIDKHERETLYKKDLFITLETKNVKTFTFESPKYGYSINL